MKIQQLILENFQSHANSTINFHPNFNCIVGPTNVGKTAVFNAILFVFLNEWDSDFLRHDTTQCSVTAICDTVSVKRVKGKNINSLEIAYNDGTIQKYDNFGTDYPEVVKNMFTGFIQDLPVCVAYQDSNSFLIHEPPSVKGKIIDYLSGISILEETVTRISAKERELKDSLASLEFLQNEISQELDQIASLGDLDKIQAEYETLAKTITDIKARVDRISFIREQISRLDRQLTDLKKNAAITIANPHEILNFLDQYEKAREIQLKVTEVNDKLKNVNCLLQNNKAEREALLIELTDVLNKYNLCPFCGSKLSSDAVDHIFKDLL